jgi:predicted dehydrogenase
MAEKTRWGVLGTGFVAHKFAQGLAVLDDAQLMAVASRCRESAERFGDEFRIPRRYESYESLARDQEIDAVYVATPHTRHKDDTLMCLNQAKAVLCEKPFGINAAQAGTMIGCAREKHVFLMEAMWTHFFPAMAKVRRIVGEGALGEIQLVKADFCFRSEWQPGGRLLNLRLGGGALLDVGVYTVALAQMVFGREPERIAGMANLGKTGVDEQAAMILGYAGGAMAVLTCAIRTDTLHEASVFGTEGWIEVPEPFWQPDRIVLHRRDKKEEFVFERLGNGYSFQAAEVMRCLREGRRESDVMPLEKTLAIMRTMDRIRKQWELRYPTEDVDGD